MQKEKKYTSIRVRIETNEKIEQNLKNKRITKIDYIEYLLYREEEYNKLLLEHLELKDKYNKLVDVN